MTSQLVIFRAFFYIFFFVPPTLDLNKQFRKSTYKKILALIRNLVNLTNKQSPIILLHLETVLFVCAIPVWVICFWYSKS